MKRWDNVVRIGIRIDFGRGLDARKLGEAAIADRRTFFQFDPDYAVSGPNPSPVKTRLDTAAQLGTDTLEGLPGFLHDSLPDGWARRVLDRALRQAGFDHTSLTALDRLALVGANGSGALAYDGPRLRSFEPPVVDFDTAAALVGKGPDAEDGDLVRDALSLAGSLGGARPKANLWRVGETFVTRGEPGSTPWIAKFPAVADGPDAGAMEYAYSLMASAAGIDMPPTTLLPSRDCAGYFAVERFDRTPGGGRLHMHSLGGLLNASTHSALGYSELMKVTGSLTQASGTDVASIEQQIARMAFNVFARNRDDHVKNHAFLMDGDGIWRPAPAFDLTYTNFAEHALLVGRNGKDPSDSDMLEVARAGRIPERRATEIIGRVREATSDWLLHAKEANVSAALARDINSSLNPTRAGSAARTAFIARGTGSGL